MLSPLLLLPPELRLRILSLALSRPETKIELQNPVRAGLGLFAHPLTATNHQLRTEALQAFYETNIFSWIVDTSLALRSNPADYPFPLEDSDTSAYGQFSVPLTPVLPWEYPLLFQHLRRVEVEIHLPSEGEVKAWSSAFPRRLERLVEVLERGVRLKGFWVRFTTRRFDSRVVVDEGLRDVLLILGRMEVRGAVGVGMRGDYGVVDAGVGRLGLEAMMRA